jgi:hypothetical protein
VAIRLSLLKRPEAAEPVHAAKPFTEESDTEHRHRHDTQLVDGRHPRGVTQLQGPKIANP